MVAEAILPKAVQITQRLLAELSKHKETFAKALEVTKSKTSAVSTVVADTIEAAPSNGTTNDNGSSQAKFKVRELLGGHLAGLHDLPAHLSGNVSLQNKNRLSQIIRIIQHSNDEVTPEQGLELLETLQEISAQLDSTGNSAVDDHTIKEPQADQKTNGVEQSPEDTKVVLENLLGLINAKITKRNGHIYMFLKWAGPMLRFFGINVPTAEELPQKVQESITQNPKFVNALKAVIENKEVNTDGMSWMQKMIFSSSKKLLSYSANHPEAILEGGPQAAYALKYMSGTFIPLVGNIPVVGRLLRWAYPFVVDEMESAGEIKEREYLSNILERLAKYHKVDQPEGPPENKQASSQ